MANNDDGSIPVSQFDWKQTSKSPEGSIPVDQFDWSKSQPARGALGEIGTGFKRGVMGDLPQQIGQGVQFANRVAGGENSDIINRGGQSIADFGAGQLNRPDMQLQPEAHNVVTNALVGGAEQIPASVAPYAATVAASKIPGMGALAHDWVPEAVTGATFGAGQAEQTYESAKKAGLSDADAMSTALKTGAIEAGGETLGEHYLGNFAVASQSIALSACGTWISHAQ